MQNDDDDVYTIGEVEYSESEYVKDSGCTNSAGDDNGRFSDTGRDFIPQILQNISSCRTSDYRMLLAMLARCVHKFSFMNLKISIHVVECLVSLILKETLETRDRLIALRIILTVSTCYDSSKSKNKRPFSTKAFYNYQGWVALISQSTKWSDNESKLLLSCFISLLLEGSAGNDSKLNQSSINCQLTIPKIGVCAASILTEDMYMNIQDWITDALRTAAAPITEPAHLLELQVQRTEKALSSTTFSIDLAQISPGTIDGASVGERDDTISVHDPIFLYRLLTASATGLKLPGLVFNLVYTIIVQVIKSYLTTFASFSTELIRVST